MKVHIKLPKQFKHWCKRHGIYEDRQYKGIFKGQRRHWRIALSGEFEMSETYRTFDRWANSYVCGRAIPKTQSEFDAMIKRFKEI